MAEELEWAKLPQDLQHRFFELAEEESRRLSLTVQRLDEELRKLSKFLRTYFDGLPSVDRTYKVAAVDSSRSPRLSERLGIRYGVFTSGIMYLRGAERREVFEAGVFKRRQALSEDVSRFFFDLLTAYIERRLAVKALSDSDLVIIDGSFYSFLYQARRMKKQGLYGEREDKLVRDTFQTTETLLESGKAIGVIKRSHTRAIGGYLALREDRANPFTSIIDKLILSLLMPACSIFDYHKLLGERPVPIYTELARLAQRGTWPENPLQEAESRAYSLFEYLNLDASEFRGLKRMQVRAHGEAPPCEVEYPSRIGVADLLEWLGQSSFFNEATNLPMVLDLVDGAVSLSEKFTGEFVSEVEGRVAEIIDKSGGNRETVKAFFALLNPQKPY